MSGEFDLQIVFTVVPTLMLFGSVSAAVIAQAKGRDATYWMISSFLFPPAVIVLLVFISKADKRKPPRRSDDENGDAGPFILP